VRVNLFLNISTDPGPITRQASISKQYYDFNKREDKHLSISDRNQTTMWENILPYNLMLVLQNLKMRKNNFEWKVRCDDESTYVNMKWSSDTREKYCTGSRRSWNVLPRHKPPSAIKRDRERRHIRIGLTAELRTI
jgi:hypothetical protein